MRVFSLLRFGSQTRTATGHRQGLYLKTRLVIAAGFFLSAFCRESDFSKPRPSYSSSRRRPGPSDFVVGYRESQHASALSRQSETEATGSRPAPGWRL